VKLLLDANVLAVGHEYYRIDSLEISPDDAWLAFCEDTVGRRQYTLRFKNLATGAEIRGATTETGNYTISSLSVAAYQLTVTATGFKTFVQDGINVQVAQTGRVDVVLQVGAATESITVTADAALLKTENSEQSTTIDKDRLLSLPLYFGSGQGGHAPIRPQPASHDQKLVHGC